MLSKCLVNGIQGELDKLCLTQVKNQINEQSKSNYFSFGALNSSNTASCFGSPISSNKNYIKPSTFNLNLNDGMPKITKNYSNDLIRKPRLNLDQMNFFNNSVMKSGFQTSNNQSNQQSNTLPQPDPANCQTNCQIQNNQTNIYQINKPTLNLQVNISFNKITNVINQQVSNSQDSSSPFSSNPLSFGSISNESSDQSTALTVNKPSDQGNLFANASSLLNN